MSDQIQVEDFEAVAQRCDELLVSLRTSISLGVEPDGEIADLVINNLRELHSRLLAEKDVKLRAYKATRVFSVLTELYDVCSAVDSGLQAGKLQRRKPL